MSRRSKGPRLYLRTGRTHARTGRAVPDAYYIRDGQVQVSTGCGPERLREAEQALADYIASKWQPTAQAELRPSDPSSVLIAEVLALYALEKASKSTDPVSHAGWGRALLEWWGERTVADVKRSSCQAYVAYRTSQPLKQAKYGDALKKRVSAAGARRELEDLSAAIGHWHGEHTLTGRPKVWLPPKAESPRDALTRSQAAALLWAAMGWRKGKNGRWTRLGKSARANRAHVRRFILMGLYTGTRPGVLPKLLWHESPTQAWVDLDAGVIYRRGKREQEHRTKRRPLVRVPDRLLAHMRRWERLDRETMQRSQNCGEQLVITTVLHHGGEPIAGRIRRGYASCVADAGLNPEITPHWHRHTAATWLMENGADPWMASGFLGMSVKILLDNYDHHRPDHQADARRAISGR